MKTWRVELTAGGTLAEAKMKRGIFKGGALSPVLENDSHKLLWDFSIHMDHQISVRKPDLIIINKKRENLQNSRLCCPG